MNDELAIGQQRPSKTRTAILVMAIVLSATVLRVHAEDSAEPPISWNMALVLKAPDKAILYSLEPWEPAAPTEKTLHGFKILGKLNLDRDLEKAVAAEFEAAIGSQDGTSAGCFDPRHALSVTSGGKTYDFLLCYACGELEIFRGKDRVADMPAHGTGEALNAILSAHKVPVSRSDIELRASQEQAQERSKLAESRWLAGMPSAIKPLWPHVLERRGPDPVGALDPLRIALSMEFPDERSRILALYAWFGSGEGPWSGFPTYEMVAEELLLDFPTEALIAAAEAARNTQQLEGAARLFGGWDFSQHRPSDLTRLPPDLKKRLRAHLLENADEYKRYRAHDAFD